MLLTDTNILQRVCLGEAMKHVRRLRERGVTLGTTAHNLFELENNLLGLGFEQRLVDERVADTVAPLQLLWPDEYQYLQNAAYSRLRQGGKSDWPLLAAAMAIDGDIWSEDKDFFGVGVPVWTTDSLRFVQQD